MHLTPVAVLQVMHSKPHGSMTEPKNNYCATQRGTSAPIQQVANTESNFVGGVIDVQSHDRNSPSQLWKEETKEKRGLVAGKRYFTVVKKYILQSLFTDLMLTL